MRQTGQSSWAAVQYRLGTYLQRLLALTILKHSLLKRENWEEEGKVLCFLCSTFWTVYN